VNIYYLSLYYSKALALCLKRAETMTSELTIIPRGMVNLKASKTVGLISDTHVPARASCIPKMVFKIFENVDFIVHAGDLVKLEVIDELEQLAPVLAVHGNMHDPSTLFGRGKMREIAKENGFDAFVYGHTHNANIKWEGKILYINPGSPTNPMSSFINKPSVALLKITKETIIPEIVQI
jgi:predicted phosphodiesterase